MGKLAPIALVLLGLIGGFAGAYFGMPKVRPEYVKDLYARYDSIRALGDTTAVTMDSMSVAPGTPSGAMLLDSLQRLRNRIQELEQHSNQIDESRQELAVRLDSLTQVGGDAAEIASTLTILEDDELSHVVEKLDDDVLRALYVTASRKNKARLLRAMPPERAGHLIRSLFDDVDGNEN